MKPRTSGLITSLLIVLITLTGLAAASAGGEIMQNVIRVSALLSTQEAIILVVKVNLSMN